MSHIEETNTINGASKLQPDSCDVVTNMQHRSKPMSSPRHHVRAETSTMVLYQGDNDKPTITLTTYIDEFPARQFKLRLVEPKKPDDDDLITPASLDETFGLRR
jgi:hypothetical protein